MFRRNDSFQNGEFIEMETSDLHVSRCQNKKHTDQLEVIHIFLRMRQSHQQFCRAKAQRTPTHTEKLEHSAEGTWTKTMYLRQSSPPGLINNRHNLCRRAQTQIHLNQINWSYTRSKHIKGSKGHCLLGQNKTSKFSG